MDFTYITDGIKVNVSWNDLGRVWQAIFPDHYDGAPDTPRGMATAIGSGETPFEAIWDLFWYVEG
jgi:hypothetical protein